MGGIAVGCGESLVNTGQHDLLLTIYLKFTLRESEMTTQLASASFNKTTSRRMAVSLALAMMLLLGFDGAQAQNNNKFKFSAGVIVWIWIVP